MPECPLPGATAARCSLLQAEEYISFLPNNCQTSKKGELTHTPNKSLDPLVVIPFRCIGLLDLLSCRTVSGRCLHRLATQLPEKSGQWSQFTIFNYKRLQQSIRRREKEVYMKEAGGAELII